MIVSSNFFSFFQEYDFSGFQSSSVNAKKKFWGVPHFLHMCVFFLVNDNPFSIKPTVVGVKISEKKKHEFLLLKFLYLFQSGQNNGVEIWAFAVTRSISM